MMLTEQQKSQIVLDSRPFLEQLEERTMITVQVGNVSLEAYNESF